MKKIVLSLSTSVILLLASISAYSQTLWQSSEKGMTVEQVEQKFPNAVKPVKADTFYGGKKALLEIPDYKIGSNTFKVQFVFQNSELDFVRMEMNDGLAEFGFENMRKLLKTKYGEPLDNASNNMHYTVSWLDNGTSISLTNIMNILLVIMYEADDIQEADKL